VEEGGGEHWGNAYNGRGRGDVVGGSQVISDNTTSEIREFKSTGKMGGWGFVTFPTLHCYQSHGVVVKLPTGFKVGNERTRREGWKEGLIVP